MSGKPKKLTKKARQLLRTAHELFMKHGIRRITVEEICREADVSKMTFYKYFTNKNAVALRVAEDIYEEGWAKAWEIFAENLSFPEQLQKIMLWKMEASKRWSPEFVKDLMTGDNLELKEFIEQENARSIREIREMFVRAQENGDLRPDMNVDFMMFMIGVLRKLFQDEQLHALFPDMATLMQNVFKMFYYGVLADKHKR
ncbi:MAG: TetR/AcrR family transcriptional regulator [bacterium]|nr:TetR/AcrR family transcriptional regulator [bacterium]